MGKHEKLMKHFENGDTLKLLYIGNTYIVNNVNYKKEEFLELLDKEGLESYIVLWHNNHETNICVNSSPFSFVSQWL